MGRVPRADRLLRAARTARRRRGRSCAVRVLPVEGAAPTVDAGTHAPAQDHPTSTGTIVGTDGDTDDIDRARLLAPLEGALRALSWAAVSLAVTLALARLTPVAMTTGTVDRRRSSAVDRPA